MAGTRRRPLTHLASGGDEHVHRPDPATYRLTDADARDTARRASSAIRYILASPDNSSQSSLMLPSITIRSAVSTDVSAIAGLLDQLGYPTTPQEAATQLARLREFPNTTELVAELQGKVIGLVTGHVFPSIHAPSPVAWITTLVIDQQHLHSGVGKQLCTVIEAWAQNQGAKRVSVTSGKHRDGAHAFYERIGYERTGLRLSKALL